MAYTDKYSDAAIFYDLNNNMTPVINTTVASGATVTGGPTGTTGTPVYYADVPPGSPYTHSLRLNNSTYTTLPKSKLLGLGQSQTYTNNYGYNSWGETVNFWYKVVPTTITTNIGNAVTFMRREEGTTDEVITVQGGANYVDPTGAVGKFVWSGQQYVTSAANLSTFASNAGMLPGITPDQWYNVTIAWATHQNATTLNGKYLIERAIYLNGTLAHNTFYNATNGLDASANPEFFFFNTGTTNVQIMSSLALWNRVLTQTEIMELAFNNNIITDINTYNNAVVTTSGATYYTTMNNPDKDTPTDVYGTGASWGPLNDTPGAITVNQESKFGKSWLWHTDGTYSQEVDVSAGAAMNLGLSEATRADGPGWSIECWVKTTDISTVTRKLSVLFGPSFSANRIDFGIQTAGGIVSVPWATVPNWASGNTYTSATVNGNTSFSTTSGNSKWTYSSSAPIKDCLVHHPKGITDGEWHHIVVTYRGAVTGSDQGGTLPQVRVYLDGLLTNYAALSTGIWGTHLYSAFTNVFMGHPSSVPAQATDFYLDKYAVYNRRLTINEINKHWVIGKAYMKQQQNLVKYWDGTQWATSTGQKVWNGTDWIDWNASYYDGNSWISI